MMEWRQSPISYTFNHRPNQLCYRHTHFATFDSTMTIFASNLYECPHCHRTRRSCPRLPPDCGGRLIVVCFYILFAWADVAVEHNADMNTVWIYRILSIWTTKNERMARNSVHKGVGHTYIVYGTRQILFMLLLLFFRKFLIIYCKIIEIHLRFGLKYQHIRVVLSLIESQNNKLIILRCFRIPKIIYKTK